MSAGVALRARTDPVLPGRLARSAAAAEEGSHLSTKDFAAWFAARSRANQFRVERIPFAELEGWGFHATTGNLAHRTGRFFTVEGLYVSVGEGPYPEWQQPIINQPEVGVLGILAKEFDGVLHFLMQAKMEPGNLNLVQLSPTVQATRSNYTRVHGGAPVRYLEHFTGPRRGRAIADVLQSEHGAWFYHKSNRNTIVEVEHDVPVDDDFCWLTLGQIGELLRRDNLVNMDSRTVLSCAPILGEESAALLSDTDLLSWFTTERARHDVQVQRIPLRSVADWRRGERSIEHVPERYFRVMAVAVEASNREVSGWSQPLFEPVRHGLTAFVTRTFDGVPHLLAHARVEAGFLDTIELGPTVQCTPEHYTHLPEADQPKFMDMVLEAPTDRVLYEAVHSEEGGRFFHAQNRYLVVDADESTAPTTPPTGYRWVTPGQLDLLMRHGRYVNVQARTLLSVLTTGAVRL